MIKIVVSGALGRMGKRIIALAEKDPELVIAGRLEKEPHPEEGIVGNLNSVKADYACIIEFTTPEATLRHVEEARRLKRAMVIGTTGLSEKELDSMRKASKDIPIVFSPNMSVGVNVLFNLIGKAAVLLGKKYKVRIKETHHIHKKDRPSGTAKLMRDIVKQSLGEADIPTESVREGEIVGDHDIIFESEVDTLKISHSARTRDIFALGALKAAKFIATKKTGLFSMKDVLEIDKD